MRHAALTIPLLALSMMIFGRGTAIASPPCEWFTRAEIATALGTEVREVKERKNLVTDKPNGCAWKTGDLLIFAVVEANERASDAEAQKTFAQTTMNAARLPGGHSAPITPVSGIGDEAANVGDVLYVRKGALVFSLSVFDSNKTQTTTPSGFAKAKALVQAAWSRI